ncbi:MAG TPA: C69 family dipeptidase [Bacteroidales bacterium]|nr:C69 family dipeptidase [Bacteroidales bacterium]
MKHLHFYTLAILFLVLGEYQSAFACTNYIVTRGASADGSVMITYAADSHTLYGELYYRPAKDYPKGALLEITEWDTGKPLGKIKQVPHTYSVIGNMNEHQLAIGETTFGGKPELQDTTGIIDYGSLIYITLQRAKTAREAIKIIGELTDEYGYCSEGESFSIADKNEAWILEIIGKGPGNKGALWVAARIPDGYVSGHANQARIQTFPLNDPENCLYAKDVISFARTKGWFKGEDKEFSFSDTYAPVDFSGARFCEIRVWSMFNKVNSDMAQYWDYATGHNLTKRMPLFIKPDRKITVSDMMGFMRDHLEGTELDMSKDFGAGPFGLPYRWRPLTWESDSVTYCNERATATQQTGFSFVAQSRSWLPDPVGGILWFGVDDAASSVYTPMYCGMNKIPQPFAEGNGDMLTYSESSAFWAFNFVANFCYLRYNVMIEDVKKVQHEMESKFIKETAEVDKTASALLKTDRSKAIAYLTGYSVKAGNSTFNRWKELGHYLLIKYIDGNIKKEKDGKFLYNGYNQAAAPLQPGYPENWKRKVAEDTGDKLKVSGDAH